MQGVSGERESPGDEGHGRCKRERERGRDVENKDGRASKPISRKTPMTSRRMTNRTQTQTDKRGETREFRL